MSQTSHLSQLTADRLAVATTLGIAAAIMFLSLLPHEATPDAPGSDKLHHFVAYAAFAFPICAVRPRAALWMVPLAAAFGGAIELIQPHFGRHPDWGDFIANATGATIGAALAWAGHRVLLRRLLRAR